MADLKKIEHLKLGPILVRSFIGAVLQLPIKFILFCYFRKYLIVDFPDGSHVIPKKWIKTNINGETTCFFPSVKCLKTFCKMSKDMVSPDKKHWVTCQITKIASSSGNIVN